MHQQICFGGALALLVLITSGGCETPAKTASSPNARSTPPTMSAVGSKWTGREPTAAATERVSFEGERESGRRSTIVALYGETISNASATIGFGDGASNISQLTFTTEGADFDPDVEPGGRWLYFASTRHRTTADIYRKRLDGSTVTQLTSDPADEMMPEVSPDGTRLAFCSNRAGNWDIYIMPVEGGQPTVITTDTAAEIHPSWSPDGRQLVYSKFNDQNNRWELWTVDVDNTSVRNFIDYGFLPEWSPDPAVNKILFQRARTRGSRYHSVWTIDLIDGQGRNPTEIVSASNAAVINPSWAPDGDHIVFVTVLEPESQPQETPEQSDLWIVRLDGTERVNLTNGDSANFQPTFTRDQHVVFVSSRAGLENLWTISAAGAIDGARGRPGSDIANVPADE